MKQLKRCTWDKGYDEAVVGVVKVVTGTAAEVDNGVWRRAETETAVEVRRVGFVMRSCRIR